MLNQITTHQELLEAWINERSKVIHEFSGEIHTDCEELFRQARYYAGLHGLNAPSNPETYGIYTKDEECLFCKEREKNVNQSRS